MKTSTKPQAIAAPDYRVALLNLKLEVLANLNTKFDAIASMGRVNEEDQAQYSHDEFLQLTLNSLDYEKLRLVDAALGRLEEGEYGVCLACEEKIPARRLQAIPWARYCVGCQERAGKMDVTDEDPASMFAHFAAH